MSDKDTVQGAELDLKKSQNGGYVLYYWTPNGEIIESRGNEIVDCMVGLVNKLSHVDYPLPYELIGRDEPFPLYYGGSNE